MGALFVREDVVLGTGVAKWTGVSCGALRIGAVGYIKSAADGGVGVWVEWAAGVGIFLAFGEIGAGGGGSPMVGQSGEFD